MMPYFGSESARLQGLTLFTTRTKFLNPKKEVSITSRDWELFWLPRLTPLPAVMWLSYSSGGSVTRQQQWLGGNRGDEVLSDWWSVIIWGLGSSAFSFLSWFIFLLTLHLLCRPSRLSASCSRSHMSKNQAINLINEYGEFQIRD